MDLTGNTKFARLSRSAVREYQVALKKALACYPTLNRSGRERSRAPEDLHETSKLLLGQIASPIFPKREQVESASSVTREPPGTRTSTMNPKQPCRSLHDVRWKPIEVDWGWIERTQR